MKPILLVVTIFVFGAVIFSVADGAVLRIFSPIWSGEHAIGRGLNNMVASFKSKDDLIKENQILKNKIVSDQMLFASSQTINSSGRAAKQGIDASILVRPPETPYDILVIDVGSDDGVAIGQSVTLTLQEENAVGPKVGEITEVFKKNSKVRLYSATGQKTNAVLERNSVPVVLVGRGGGNFEFTLPRESEIKAGDKILSTDITRALVGVVKDIEVSPTDSFKLVLVVSAINIYKENFVTVLK